MRYLSLAIIGFLCITLGGCTTSRFARGGIFTQDVDLYFNPKEKVNVWVYENYKPYPDELKKGLRMDSLYSDDKAVMQSFDLWTRRGTKILFSSFTTGSPTYHLVAITHHKASIDTAGYVRKTYNKAYYYQKDDSLANQVDIRHVYIPYGQNKALSLLYYTQRAQHQACPFCKVVYLANINAEELQMKKNRLMQWQVFDTEQQRLEDVTIPLKRLKKTKYIKIYADYGTQTGVHVFRILDKKGRQEMPLKLGPNNYFVHYLDKSYQTIRQDTIQVEAKH